MDIEYLLLLQNFREYTETFLAPIMDWVTKMSVSFWPTALILMIYWAGDRKAGRRMLMGISLGYLMNGFLKLTFCAYRPWIRDARIEPYGDAKVAATGYSFPSGHTTSATVWFGSAGHWFKNRIKILTVILYSDIFLTMFSRNYLGVHTPQDVIVGFAVSVLMLIAGNYLDKWSDADPARRDLYIMAAGIMICILLVVYYMTKTYPIAYSAEGTLLVDPKNMLPDSFEGIGFGISLVICRYFERRGFDFENKLDWKTRFVIGTIALIPAMWWCSHIVNLWSALNLKIVGKLFLFSGIVVYATVIVPLIMKKVYERSNEAKAVQS